MTVKFDSAFIKLCVCVKKSNFLSWAIRPIFTDPVKYDVMGIYISKLPMAVVVVRGLILTHNGEALQHHNCGHLYNVTYE